MSKKHLEQVRLEGVIAHSPQFIFWKDVNSIYLGCNENFAYIAGLPSAKDIIGRTDYDLPWAKFSADLYINEDKIIVSTGDHLEQKEVPLVTAQGKEIVVMVSKSPLLDEKGRVIGILGVYMDITDRKKIEQELIESKERAEAASKAKSEFLSIVSHELRIPLTGILGMARLMNADSLQPDQHKKIDDIIYSAEHLQSIINDVLDAAKLEAGKMVLHLEPLDLRKLIEEIATIMSYSIKEKKLELLVDYKSDLPHLVYGDTKALRQIILNILGNAIKFTEQGYIAIKVSCLNKTDSHAVLAINIEDTGIGIPKNKLDKVFDRFNQADSSSARKYGGIGLGLTISKSYVELMNGSLYVQSEQNKGSNFTLAIPFQLQDLDAKTFAWDVYKSSVRVLIVDDAASGKQLARAIASPLCEVIKGQELLNTLLVAQRGNHPFDIVIINQGIKNVDPLELSRTIKKHNYLYQPMLIALVSNDALSTQDLVKEAGFFDYLVKNPNSEDLLMGLTMAWEKWKQKMQPFSEIEVSDDVDQMRLLLVEDDAIVRRVHQAMLEKLNCVVDCATTGMQALEIANSKKYDLIFMDVGLPDITGYEVTKKIRGDKGGRSYSAPIVGLTGYDTKEDRQRCFDAGMDDVAIKPIKPDQLKQILIRWEDT